MKFKTVGNRPKPSVLIGFNGTFSSAARLATLGVALATSIGVVGCAGFVGSPAPGAGGGSGFSGASRSSQLSPSSAAVAFGNVTVGSSTSELVTLTVAGRRSVTISSVTASGTGFAVSPKSNIVLAPNQSMTVSVSFQPTAAGSSVGDLLVASNASNSRLQVSLSGDGVTQAQAPANHSVALNWQASSSPVSGYYVFRGSTAGNLSQLDANAVATTSYTDKTVADGQTYVYAVKSMDSANILSGYSNLVTVSVPAN